MTKCYSFINYIDAILELIVVLSRHSISVKELKSLLASLKGENNTWVLDL